MALRETPIFEFNNYNNHYTTTAGASIAFKENILKYTFDVASSSKRWLLDGPLAGNYRFLQDNHPCSNIYIKNSFRTVKLGSRIRQRLSD